MPGSWLTRMARRLTRPDTFDALVAPAIADLQHEATHGWMWRLRHYAAFALVLGCAALRDARMDVRTAFGGEAWRQIWAPAVVWAGLAGCCSWTAMYVLTLRMLERLDGPTELEAAVLNGVIYRSIVPAMVAGLVVGAYRLKRREPSQLRTVMSVSLIFIAATPIIGAIASGLHAPALHRLEEAYRMAQPGQLVAFVPPPWQTVMSGMMQTAAFAWLGVALARYRGWRLALNATTILTLYVAANIYQFRMVHRFAPSLTPWLYGIPAIPANAVTMVLLILLCRLIQRPFAVSDRPVETA